MSGWARFLAHDGRAGFGIVEDSRILEYDGAIFGDKRATGRTLSRDAVTLQSPCIPGKIVALWNNFHALCEKLGKPAPTHPQFLLKAATSVIGPNEPIVRPGTYAGKIVYEGELGVVIGKRCTEIRPDEADSHIFGYTCVNDVTAMGVLNENVDFAQWCRAKSYDTFGCLGPIIVTGLDWSRLNVITRLDGVERQNYPLADMIFPPAELVSLISHDMTLLPGDVIACGTSVGVGSIKDGSAVEVDIEGIGVLRNILEPRALG
ncbi:MAG TPA: fumarylacetoacetate hydrolase family protein [Steroidobacteraceae bacterium]|jgi:2-keto-4-pentenoate hydratase/2-oxohepta-3-ene-1,7-dioic acid hydratase in catechol pathway